jgi:WD40 repeat protein
MPSSTKIFRLFVSSTFSDLIDERNALQSRVYPKLAALCRAQGASFQAVDLRWGVSEQAAEDQRTMRICLAEIDRCREMTPRPNFILLLGERYGWRPIPEQIPAAEFEEICDYYSRQMSHAQDLKLLGQWYVRDENALPPLYELQSRQARCPSYARWLSVETRLGAILRQAAQALDFSPAQLRRYQSSATEQEIAHRGLLDGDIDDQAAFLFFRKIDGLPAGVRTRQYQDLDQDGAVDPDARASLACLKAKLRSNFPAGTFDYRTRWEETGPSKEHLDAFCNDAYRQLSAAILQVLSGQAHETQLDAELRAHARFAEQRTGIFVGRRDTLARIDEYLAKPAKFPLVIHGPSGSGKSSVIARALQSAAIRWSGEPIYRFIGSVAGSSNIRLLLASLCSQLRGRNGRSGDLPVEYSDLVHDFRNQLSACAEKAPVLIILDALDQLYEQYDAHGLAWLPIELPANVHLIVSCLPGECFNRLQDKVPPGNLHRLDPMTREDAEVLLDSWLGEAGRCLQPGQRQTVVGAFRKTGLPLYLRLMFEQARAWPSSFKPAQPAKDVPGLIRNTFAALSSDGRHGPVMVARSLAYIAAGKSGLSHEELLEILSRDPRVMADFRRRSPSSPPTDALPGIIWSQLYLDLAPYLTEDLVPGGQVIDFFHRQLREVVQKDYLSAGRKSARHRALSEYFADQELLVEADGKRAANLRKLTEWPFQLSGARDWPILSRTLSDFRFLHAKVSALGPEAVIEDFDLLDGAGDDALPAVDFESLRNLQACLRLAAGVISQHPGQLPAQLHGRLGGRKSTILRRLLREAAVCTSFPWLRPLNESLSSTGGPLLTNYVIDRIVEVIAISADAATLLIGCDDGSVRLVDIDRRIEVRRMQLHPAAVVAIKPLPGSPCFASGSREGNVAVWDDSGKIYFRCQAALTRLYDLDVSADGGLLIAGGEGEREENSRRRCGNISVWDLVADVEKQRLQVEPGGVSCVVLSPRDRVFLCGTSHGSFQKWKLGDETPLATAPFYDGGVFRIRLLPDARRALICSGDQSTGQYNLRLWDVDRWRELHVFRGHHYMLSDVAVAPAGDRALSASYDQTICLWDLERYQLISRLGGHRRPVRSVIVEPGADIAYSASGKSVYRWSLDPKVRTGNMLVHADRVHSVAAAAGGRRAVSAAADGSIAVWDFNGTRPAVSRRSQLREVRRLCLSKDAQILFFTGEGKTVRRADLQSGSETMLLDLPDTRPTALVCSAGGEVLFVGCKDGSLLAWDLARGVALWRVADAHVEEISSLALINRGRWLISAGGDFFLRGWRTRDGSRIAEMHNGSGAPDVAGAFSSRIVAAGTHYGRVHVWGRGKTEMMWDLAHAEIGQNYSVTAVACSPDGQYVLTGGTDETVHTWDTRTGARIATFIAEDRSTCAHALGRNRFMVGSRNGAVHFLQLEV